MMRRAWCVYNWRG